MDMTRKSVSALAAYIFVILVAGPQAQQAPAYGGAASASPALPATSTTIQLLVGRSTLLDIGSTISRVSLTVPDVADAMVTSPTQLLIHGKQPGTISMFVWDRMGGIKTFEVTVRRDLSALMEQVKQLFPGEPISVAGSGKDVVLSGTVTSKYVIDKAAEVAAGYVEKKENVVNLLKQQEGVASNQVMLRVRFAEVSRSALQELGASWIVNGFKTDWFGRASTQQFAAPDFDSDTPGGLVFSDFLNLFVFNAKEGLGAVVRALQNKGLFQSLAEPNLVATNGKEASFLAGGEYPYPVVQPNGNSTAITIMFKEFGVRLNFTPTVLGGDLVNIKVRPEVSALDFSNAITLEGFRIPALSTRRTETEVELRDGQTFAIAGLMNNTLTTSMSKIPGIGDIPILGKLFQSRAHQKNQTELVVMITPIIIRRGQMGVSEGLPNLVEPFLGRPDKGAPQPDAYIGSPRYPLDQQRQAPPSSMTAQPAPAANNAPQNAQAPAAQPAEQPSLQQPVSARPIGGEASLPEASPQPEPKVDKKALEAEKKRLAREAEEQRKAEEAAEKLRAAEAKKQADEARVAARRDEEARKKAEKIEKERAKKQADADRKAAEIARKKAEEDEKRDKAMAEAAARLKQAQAAYQAELERNKGGQ
jgi:pilus assembly protein CpaC